MSSSVRVLALMIVVGGCAPRDNPPRYHAYVTKISRGGRLGASAVLGVNAADAHATLAPRLVGLLRDATRTSNEPPAPAKLDEALVKVVRCETDVACLVLAGKELDPDIGYLTWGMLGGNQLALRMVRVRGQGHGVVHTEIVAIAGADESLDVRTRTAYSRLVARARGTTIRVVGPRKLRVRLDGQLLQLQDRRRSIDHVAAGSHRVDLVLTSRNKSGESRERTIVVDFVADDKHDILIKLDD